MRVRIARMVLVGVLMLLAPAGARAASTAFAGNGMWIWYLDQSAGGSVPAIARVARAHHVSTVFIKSSDGATRWGQFSASKVAALKAAGLRVCAWPFVYGADPVGEARASAAAVARGADCLVIDAESAYEGRYAQAQRYVYALRTRVGRNFPVGLASFPFVDYHPGLPYSVFLGPGGAQWNVPQVYWQTIGVSVDDALTHTYRDNRIYARPIAPLGQLYGSPPLSQILRFRRLSAGLGAPGVSWWSWQSASSASLAGVGTPLGGPAEPTFAWPALRLGSSGDRVVWAQEHLAGEGHPVPISGYFGRATDRALRAVQAEAGLRVTGVTDARTWDDLLGVAPVVPRWTARGAVARAGGARRTGPASARLPARRNEIPGGPLRPPLR